MTQSEVIMQILRYTQTTQQELADKMGYKTQGTVSNRLNRGNMKTDTFIKMLNVLGYEVVVRPVGAEGPGVVVDMEK